jgi:hypothetical protein
VFGRFRVAHLAPWPPFIAFWLRIGVLSFYIEGIGVTVLTDDWPFVREAG